MEHLDEQYKNTFGVIGDLTCGPVVKDWRAYNEEVLEEAKRNGSKKPKIEKVKHEETY